MSHRSEVVAGMPRSRWPLVVVAAALSVVVCASVSSGPAVAGEATIRQVDGKYRVEIDGELFTEYRYDGYAKPILYPLLGPGGARMTRDYPQKEDSPGEAHDHRHHRSLWFTHGEVRLASGDGKWHSFWHEGAGAGKTVHEKVLAVGAQDGKVSIQTRNRWETAQGKKLCVDERTISFFSLGSARAIDYEITVRATEGEIVLGDTKEGTMGIRTHPALRIRGPVAKGKAVNSEGDRDAALWGKRAKWVDYWGPVDGQVVGVAILDHPKNPVHPTWWHARDYGLVAANPFGVSYFEKKPRGTGEMRIPAGKSVTFRYRFIFHPGDAESAGIEKMFREYAAGATGDSTRS